MAKYYYQARDRSGKVINGTIDAANSLLARKAINKLNLVVLNLSRFNLKLLFSDLKRLFEQFNTKVTFEDKMVLINQLETGISVGIPIVQMLHLLQKDLNNKFIKDALTQITEEVSQGSSLHAAFALHPKIFDPIVIGLVKTGEVSGKLETTLSRISLMIEQQAENQAKIRSAIFYPKIVLFVMSGVILAVVYFIIPKLKIFLSTFGADLPLITKFVMGTSDFFISYWYLILAGALGIRYWFNQYTSTAKGKYTFDAFKLKAPIFGTVFLNLELNNFCVILDLLIDSGVPILESLETLKESQKNEAFKEALNGCKIEIEKGGTLLNGLGNNKIFPATFKNLLGVGEESGLMQPVLKRLGRYYQLQINYQLDNLSKLIEPILLFFIFIVVLIIALAVMLPVWQLSGSHLK